MKFRVAAIEYQWFERFTMRGLFALALNRFIPISIAADEITHPNGIAHFLDLRFLLNPTTFAICRWCFLVALIFYLFRVGWAVVLPLLTLFTVCVGTVINSHGAISHYSQIVSLVLCAQTAAHFTNLIRGRDLADKSKGENRVILWSQQAIVATYLVSALTKLIHTSGMWIIQSPKIAVQIIKTNDQDYYDRLDAASHGRGQLVADWIVHHPLLVALVLGSGLILELTTPLALLGRLWALAYGLALIAFHESVERVMRLSFPFNEYLVFIYLINLPYWLNLTTRRLRRRLNPAARP